ncbi:MAG: NAD(P)/FAD-dependent oxidoreductase, partial [Bacteroidota bacterium]
MKFTKSIWNSFADFTDYPKLQQDIDTDVAVIGGGITGISVAHLLARKGMRVAVLESLKVGGGTSSHSTGNLYFTIDQNLGHLHEKYDRETIREVIASRSAALNLMEKLVKEHSLDCDFKRQPWFLYSANQKNKDRIDAEYEYARQADIPVQKASPSDFPLKVESGIMVPGQAQVNPLRYVQELARVLDTDRCQIYEHTRVKQIEEND